MIFTARQLEDLHRTNGHVVLPYGARLTPLAVDKYGSAPGNVVVLNSDGKAAREMIGDDKSPVRWFVIGISDE